jgi:hypothetical protein
MVETQFLIACKTVLVCARRVASPEVRATGHASRAQIASSGATKHLVDETKTNQPNACPSDWVSIVGPDKKGTKCAALPRSAANGLVFSVHVMKLSAGVRAFFYIRPACISTTERKAVIGAVVWLAPISAPVAIASCGMTNATTTTVPNSHFGTVIPLNGVDDISTSESWFVLTTRGDLRLWHISDLSNPGVGSCCYDPPVRELGPTIHHTFRTTNAGMTLTSQSRHLVSFL